MFGTAQTTARLVVLLLGVSAGAMRPAPLAAQWSETYEQVFFDASYVGRFPHRFGELERRFNGIDLSRALLYDALWRDARLSDEALYRAIALSPRDAPRMAGDVGPAARTFRMLVPETAATIEWTQSFRRRVVDVLADLSLTTADKDGRITELLGYYRSRKDLALSARPKDVGALNSAASSLAFRKRYPKTNGFLWSAQWLEAAIAEPLVVSPNAAEQQRMVTRGVERFRRMAGDPPYSAPYLMPMMAQVAPEASRRYPEVAAIVDNLHMLEDNVADIFVDPEVPRSAKRQEILRATAFFRDDSASALFFGDWLAMGERIGVNNMGGVAVGADADAVKPTVPLGMSLAGMSPVKSMAGMEHAGMQMPAATSDSAERMSANEFIAELLKDSTVAGRIRASPELQELWLDPDVQRRVRDLLAGSPAAGSGRAPKPTQSRPSPPSHDKHPPGGPQP